MDFWQHSGYQLLERAADGHLLVTDDYLRLYYARPELAPVEESCSAERHLHAALLEAPRRVVSDAFRNIDVIMTPSIAALSWPADIAYPETIDGRKVGPRGHAVFTGWVNACGHPAVNLPADPASNGLPIGFQMVGGFGSDAALMKLAAAYEQAANWHDRWPELALG